MNKNNLALRLKQARENRQWTQTTLAEQTGISRSRLSQLENAHRRPTLAEWPKLRSALNLYRLGLIKPAHLPVAPKYWHAVKPSLRDAERSVSSRQFAARRAFGAKEVNLSVAAVKARADQQICEQFLEQARPESGCEFLFWLKLLASGANPYRLAPSSAGFRRLRVVEPVSKQSFGDVRVACLEVQGADYRCLLFPQVTVDTRKALFRLDALVCVRTARERCWVDLELDGQGHDSTFDLERQQMLGLPTVRLDTGELAAKKVTKVLECKMLPLVGLRSTD